MFVQQIELLVHFERFRNIDLAGKGLYFIRVTAKPVDVVILQSDCKVKLTSTDGRRARHTNEVVDTIVNRLLRVNPSFIATKESNILHSCRSRVFMIKYREQEVIMNELFKFKLHFEMTKLSYSHLMDLEFELFHYKLQNDNLTQVINIEEFEMVSSRNLSLSKYNSGVHLAYPIVFDCWYFGVAHTTIHSSIVGVGLRHYEKHMRTKVFGSDKTKLTLTQIDYTQCLKRMISENMDILQFLVQHNRACDLTSLSVFLTKELLLILSHAARATGSLLETMSNPLQTDDPLSARECFEMQFGDDIFESMEDSVENSDKFAQSPPDVHISANFVKKANDAKGSEWILDIPSQFSRRLPNNAILSVHDTVNMIIDTYLESKYEIDGYPDIAESILMEQYEEFRKTSWKKVTELCTSKPTEVYEKLEALFFEKQRQTWKCYVENKTLSEVFIHDNICRSLAFKVIDKELFVQPSFSNINMNTEIHAAKSGGGIRTKNVSDIVVLKIDSPNSKLPRVKTIPTSAYRHLIVFVPGFRGSHYDFKLFKTYLAVYLNNGYDYFMPTCNDFVTEIPIEEMSLKLAESMDEYIVNSGHYYEKISFVCHSLGGIILRTAMKSGRTKQSQIMRKYHKSFHTLITLNSPHLGSICNKSFLVNSAIRYLKSWKGVKSLQQLDILEESIEESLLYKLAVDKSIEAFKNIVFVASESDSFVSSVSALLLPPRLGGGFKDWTDSTVSSEKLYDGLNNMLDEFSRNTSNSKVFRCLVKFHALSNTYSPDKRARSTSLMAQETYSSSSGSESIHSFSTDSEIELTAIEEELVQEESAHRLKLKKKKRSKRKKSFGSTQYKSSTLDRLTGKAYHTALINNGSFINGFINMYKDLLV